MYGTYGTGYLQSCISAASRFPQCIEKDMEINSSMVYLTMRRSTKQYMHSLVPVPVSYRIVYYESKPFSELQL